MSRSTKPAADATKAAPATENRPEGWEEIEAGFETVKAPESAPSLPSWFQGRKITDITKWELQNLRRGWKVMVQGRDSEGRYTDPIEAEVISHRDGMIELLLPTGSYTRPIPRERALLVTFRTLSNWEIDVVHELRQDPVINHPSSKYLAYTDLELAQEAGRRWNALRGGNKGKAVLEGMQRASGVPVEFNPILKTPASPRSSGRSILKGSVKRGDLSDVNPANVVDF